MTILILLGGKSRRMGRDKALIERPDGTRQIDYLLQLAGKVSANVIVSSNDPALRFPDEIAVMPDVVAGDGPLGALATLFAHHPGTTLVLGCDLYLLDLPTLRHLIDRRDPSRMATCYANRIDGRPEPLCAIYSGDALAGAAGALVRGERCARHFLESLDPLVLPLPHPAALDNANTPAELAECFAKLRHGVTPKTVRICYTAGLREARGLDGEDIETLAHTPAGLYEEIRFRHRLPFHPEALRATRNGGICAWDEPLAEGDEIAFTPHAAGD